MKKCGLLHEQTTSQETALVWARNRIYTLFGILNKESGDRIQQSEYSTNTYVGFSKKV
ncbi:MAG: hypothetical protein F6K40_23530 [Okeania sp. SIO3I5]|uniref:hypothetical protein n=1 Tax=Okeania sp. SIO3I5 TaxID=2607805 RepID=UPI0013BB617C|nr:hypothetical protein [Okeania sp. SIO3I5]NEQ39069.1 hypothetical protein [Okeania sp. SIO3I5]